MPGQCRRKTPCDRDFAWVEATKARQGNSTGSCGARGSQRKHLRGRMSGKVAPYLCFDVLHGRRWELLLTKGWEIADAYIITVVGVGIPAKSYSRNDRLVNLCYLGPLNDGICEAGLVGGWVAPHMRWRHGTRVPWRGGGTKSPRISLQARAVTQ